MADNTNTPGVAAPKEGNNKSISMLILSYVLGNKLFKIFDVFIKRIMVRL